MRYEVTYQVAGEQLVDQVDAADAASAAAAVQEAHGHTPDLFELIQVHLLDEPSGTMTNPLTEPHPSPSATESSSS